MESRKSRKRDSCSEILVELDCDAAMMREVSFALRGKVASIDLSRYEDVEELVDMIHTPTSGTLSVSESFGEKRRTYISSSSCESLLIKYGSISSWLDKIVSPKKSCWM